MKIKIPSSIELGGLTIKTIIDDTMIRDRNRVGEANYSKQLIALDSSMTPDETLHQAYIHELLHWIFFILNEDELKENEKLIDVMAHLLHQSLKSAEFKPLTKAKK